MKLIKEIELSKGNRNRPTRRFGKFGKIVDRLNSYIELANESVEDGDFENAEGYLDLAKSEKERTYANISRFLNKIGAPSEYYNIATGYSEGVGRELDNLENNINESGIRRKIA